MKPSVLIISGWAHGVSAIAPMGERLSGRFDVQLLDGATALALETLPEADFIVGVSMGGLLAMERLPPVCRQLVLISGTARFCSAPDYLCGTDDRVLQRMIARLQRDPQSVLDAFFANVHAPQTWRRQRESNPPNVAALTAGLEYLRTTDLREKSTQLHLPVLLLHGEADRIIPIKAAAWLNDRLPQSQLLRLDSAGHALPVHQFGQVMQAAERFLTAR